MGIERRRRSAAGSLVQQGEHGIGQIAVGVFGLTDRSRSGCKDQLLSSLSPSRMSVAASASAPWRCTTRATAALAWALE